MPLSVVVRAGGPAELRACLASLRPDLGVRDEVVVVLPPGNGELRRGLAGQPWLRVADSPADGLAAARHDLVALVDGDTVLPARWRDPLVEPFADATVVAVGPACHNSFGPQGVDLPPEATASSAAFKAFARRRWDERPAGVDVDRLGPVLSVVRRDALAAGGEPSWPELRERGRLLLVPRVLADHAGGPACALRSPRPPGAPLLSASLIVKDEEAVLADCLAALRPLADEIVVYDTGSTDRTREIAREHGATVVEGYWDDHFGDARNRSLAHCRGEWVLWVDADEVAVGDAEALRARLERASAEALLVTVRNVEESGDNEFVAPRLFRGDRARFAARIHEQVLDGVDGHALTGPHATELALVHSGYTVAAFAMKDKANRNRVLAEKAVEDGVLGPDAVVNLGRSQFAAGHLQAGVATAQAGLRRDDLTPRVEVSLLQLIIRGCVKLGRVPEARAALERLRGAAREPVTVAGMEIQVCFGEERYEQALDLIGRFPESALDDHLLTVRRDQHDGIRADSLLKLGRAAEAAAVVLDGFRRDGTTASLASAAVALEAAGSGIGAIAAVVPPGAVRRLLHQAGKLPSEPAERLAEALFARFPGDPAVLGFAAWLGDRLPLPRALEWSARLRSAGHADACPLLAIARQEQRGVRDRVLAAAVAHETFADQAAVPLLVAGLEQVTAADAEAVLAELRTLAPGLAATLGPEPARLP